MLSKKSVKKLISWLGKLKSTLCLNDWTIHFENGSYPPEFAIASIEPLPGRKVAYLRVMKGFDTLKPHTQTHALVHEFIHIHNANVNDVIAKDLKTILSSSEYELVWNTYKRQHEYAVDGLADAFCKLVPPLDLGDSND